MGASFIFFSGFCFKRVGFERPPILNAGEFSAVTVLAILRYHDHILGMSGILNMTNGDRRSDYLIQNYQRGAFVNAFKYSQVGL